MNTLIFKLAAQHVGRELTYTEEVSINLAVRQGTLHQRRCECDVCKGARETLKWYGIKVK